MKILITGASGFIGSFAVEEAVRRGMEVWAGVRATSSKAWLGQPGIHFIDLPYSSTDKMVTKLQEVKNQVGRWDYVVHIMGLTKCREPEDFERVNYQYTKNLAEALVQTEMVPQQFVYLSSLSAMGPGNEETLEEIKYTDKPRPNTLYGKSKLHAEMYLRSQPNLPVTILRPTGVYGPREKDYYVMLQTLQRHMRPAIGFAEQYTTFIYVKDLVRVIFLAIEKNKVHETYFVADGDVWPTSDYTRLAQKLLGVKWTVPVRVPALLVKGICSLMETVGGWFGKFPTLNRDKYNILSARNWKCDTSKLKEDLGFEPQYNLERGLKESIEWYRANKWL